MSALLLAALLAAAAPCEPRVHDVAGSVFTAARRVAEASSAGNFAALEGDRLYYGAESELYVFDVREPLRPRLTGKVGGIGRVRQMAVADGRVYIAARETGLWIVDATNPAAPRVLSRFDTIELATGIAVAGNVAMVGLRNNGVEFIDVTDPRRPAHIRLERTPESQHTLFRDGICYSGEWNTGEVSMIDARDMARVKTLRCLPLGGFGDGSDIQGDRLYASTGHHRIDRATTRRARKPGDPGFGAGHGLDVFDISNRNAPKHLGRCDFDAFYFIGMDMWMPRASGNYVFCADTFNGLYAVDATDPAAMRIVGRITTPDPNKPDRPGTPVTSVAVGNGAVYLTANDCGLVVATCPVAKARETIRPTPPANADYRASYEQVSSRFTAWTPRLRGQVHAAAPFGDYVYVACGQAGLAVLKETDGRYAEVAAFNLPFCGDVKVRHGRLYSAEALQGLAVYDLADPTRPQERARVTDFGLPMCCPLWVWAPTNTPCVIVSDRQNGYTVMDPAAGWKRLVRSTGCPGWERYYSDQLLGGRYFAQSLANIGFSWIDMGVTPPRVIRSRVNTIGIPDGLLAWRGDRLLVACKDEFLYLRPGQRENADGSHWRGVKKHPKGEPGPGAGQPAWDGANRLAMSARVDKEIWLLDMTDENAPKTLWGERVVGNPETGVFHRGRLLVPCGYQGLLMFERTANK